MLFGCFPQTRVSPSDFISFDSLSASCTVYTLFYCSLYLLLFLFSYFAAYKIEWNKYVPSKLNAYITACHWYLNWKCIWCILTSISVLRYFCIFYIHKNYRSMLTARSASFIGVFQGYYAYCILPCLWSNQYFIMNKIVVAVLFMLISMSNVKK